MFSVLTLSVVFSCCVGRVESTSSATVVAGSCSGNEEVCTIGNKVGIIACTGLITALVFLGSDELEVSDHVAENFTLLATGTCWSLSGGAMFVLLASGARIRLCVVCAACSILCWTWNAIHVGANVICSN